MFQTLKPNKSYCSLREYAITSCIVAATIFCILVTLHNNFIGLWGELTERDIKNDISKYLICYYVFNDTHLTPEKIDYGLCSHLIIGFTSIDVTNHSVYITEENLKLLDRISTLNYGNAKLMISVGGAGDGTFGPMVSNHANRKNFIRSLMSLIKKYKLDGVDIDWEWPVVSGGQKEKVKFIQLLHEIRVEFDRHEKKYYLSAAVGAAEAIIDVSYYVQHIAENVDFVNLMAYDYHFFTPFYPVTDFNAPLFPSWKDSISVLSHVNVNFSVYYWLTLGMPKEKLMLGLPTFGHTYRLRNNANHGRHAPAEGFGFGNEGFATYYEICQFQSSPFTVFIRDNTSLVPYAYDNHDWVSFDDAWSLSTKTQFAKDLQLGGVMVFSMNTDDYDQACNQGGTFPLIRAILSKLHLERAK